MAEPFHPGGLTAAEVARLRQMAQEMERFLRLSVAAPLSISRASGVPVISLGHAILKSALPFGPTPTPPTSLTATPGDSETFLTWVPPAGPPAAETYIVYYSTSSDMANPTFFVQTPNTSVTVTNLQNGTTYFFAVTAVYNNAQSEYSTVVSSTPSAAPTPGATCEDAPEITLGREYSYTMTGAGEEQWFRFDQANGTTYHVETTGVGVDVDLEIQDGFDCDLLSSISPSVSGGCYEWVGGPNDVAFLKFTNTTGSNAYTFTADTGAC